MFEVVNSISRCCCMITARNQLRPRSRVAGVHLTSCSMIYTRHGRVQARQLTFYRQISLGASRIHLCRMMVAILSLYVPQCHSGLALARV